METTESEYFQHLHKQAEQGDPVMQHKLGDYYWREKYFDKAGYWHSLAAEQWEKKAREGDRDSRYKLAHCFLNADGVPWSSKKAVFWLRKAAKLNHTQAQTELSKHYLEGDIIKKNIFKALYWLIKSIREYRFSCKIKLISAFLKDYFEKYCILTRKKRYRSYPLVVLTKMYKFLSCSSCKN